MAGGLGKRIISLLDWCWPFPLGIVATGLALGISTGIWLAIRNPQPPLTSRAPGQSGATGIPAHVSSTESSPAQSIAPAPPSSIAARTPAAPPTAAREASPATIPPRPEPGGRFAIPKRMGALAPSSISREISPPSNAAAKAALAKPRVAQPKVQLPPSAPRLSAAQQAEITDRLTIGRFLMDRKDYSAAIKEFQAAIAVDPASREAKAAIQQAREADAQSNSSSVP